MINVAFSTSVPVMPVLHEHWGTLHISLSFLPMLDVQNYGWEAYFSALGVACGMALLLLAPMVNLKSYVQREEAARGKLKAA